MILLQGSGLSKNLLGLSPLELDTNKTWFVMKNKTFLKYQLVVIGLVLFHLSGNATISVGPNNDLWDTAANWSPVGAPMKGDSVEITDGSLVNIGSATDTIRHLFINGGSSLIIRTGGILNVDGVPGTGVYKYAIYVWNGRINNGQTMNVTGDNCGGIMVRSFGLLDGAGEINIKGLDGIGNEGIRNQGSVIMYGNLVIEDIEYFGIYNLNDFTIMDGGQVKINRIDTRGITNLEYFTNHGKIIVKHTGAEGIYTGGIFHNYDTIAIDANVEDGIFSSDTFNNYISGFISIDSTGENGIKIQGFLNNEGEISTFNNNFSGIFSTNSNFHNAGTIIIDSCQNSGINFRNDVLINEGTIQISRVEGGINCQVLGDSIVNYGNIMVHNTRGYGLFNAIKVTNHENAMIELVNIGDYGCFQGANLDNHGSLLINHCNGHGFYTNSSSNTLTNHSTGKIEVRNCLGNPFEIKQNLSFASSGEIDIE